MPIEKIPKGEYEDTLAGLKRLLVDNTNKTNELVEEVNRLSWIIKSVDTTGSKGAEYEQNKLK